MEMRDILSKLIHAYGATGREAPVREVIRELVAPYVDETRVDDLGNLICLKRGAGQRVMLAAHMDQIGFVVADIDEKGFLRVHNVGGIRKANSLNRRVVFENGVSGLISHEVREHDIADNSMQKLFIDIGARDKAEAESRVRLGDVAVYAPEMFEMGALVAGPAMDNRAGCAMLIKALTDIKESPYEIAAVFTTQEEVGLRGATAAAFDIAPDIGLAIDVTLSGDTPKGPRVAPVLGAGIAVKVMDSSLICSPKVVKALEDAAERAAIPYQREVLTGGGTDGGAIQLTRGGVPTGVLSIPCRYVHSATETVSLTDMEGGAKLLAAFLA